ncbi:MAG: PA2778 family cysteine peptidase [Gammaproteobacteria bacterium]|nr:MAG: PA2778 family cysteine peptidase [Gammaproteobacteria bacterium]
MDVHHIRPPGLIVVICLLVSGCTANRPALDSILAGTTLPATLELADTPFFPQEAYQCGPAALATVLVSSEVDVTPEELAARVYLPKRQGSLQLELVAASRRYQRLPYQLDPELPALLAELQRGRPVLVLQNLGLASYPVWHYAVVIGFDSAPNTILLRSGDRERVMMKTGKFMRSWELANNWALVTLRPGEFPVNPDESRYLQAVAAMESTGKVEAAATFYQAALERWPVSTLAMFGLGNSYYTQGKLQRAEMQYRRLLAIQPSNAAARNNLAQVLADRGCSDAAFAEVDAALDITPQDSPIRKSLLEIRARLVNRTPPLQEPRIPCPAATESGWH